MLLKMKPDILKYFNFSEWFTHMWEKPMHLKIGEKYIKNVQKLIGFPFSIFSLLFKYSSMGI